MSISVQKTVMEISCLFLLLIATQLAYGYDLPSDIKKCKFSDANCLTGAMNYVITKYGKIGIPEMNIPPLGAVNIPDVAVAQDDKKNALWYDVEAKNMVAYGLENTTITKVRTNWEKKSVDIYGRIPSLVAKLDYSLKTKIIAFSLNATGNGSGEVQNFRFVLKCNFVVDNQGFIKIYKLSATTKIDRAIFDLTNTNSENTDLAIVMNQMLNDNWQEIWLEVNPIFDSMLRENFLQRINNVFSAIPFKDLFLPEDVF